MELVPQLPKHLSAVQRYSLAVVLVGVALGGALLLERLHFRDVEVPLFLFAVALAAWYGGPGAAGLALALSCLTFDYFFTEPVYSLYITLSDLPYFIVFAAFALLVTWFSTIRRRVEQELRQARDELQIEVAERTQQASLLNLTHDTIICPRHGFRHHVLESRRAGVVRMDAGGSDREALRMNFCGPFSPRRSRISARSCCGPGVGRANSSAPKRTGPKWWWRADGLCGATNRERPAAIMETNNDITDRKRREEEIRTASTRNLHGDPRSSKPPTRSWRLLPIRYRMTCARPFAIWPAIRNCFKSGRLPSWMKRASHYMAMILESAKRMGNLIDDLLSFSRIGRAETQKTLVSLEQLVKEALSEVRQDAGGRNIAWKIGALPTCYGDRSMLRLALVNLLSNAVKFTRTRAQAEIEIGCDGWKQR